jgi:three-Cys-motif partner protein
MVTEEFFEEQKAASQVKTNIVTKYFSAWSRIMVSRSPKNMAYIDLFSGPGIYSDGSKSTPILILETILSNNVYKDKFVTIFNDVNPDYVKSLNAAINSITNISELTHKPKIANTTIGNEIVEKFKNLSFVPTLLFVDPWGYKGLSLDLIGSVLKDWGCDCIFFFNYNRINAGVNNPKFQEHIRALFGDDIGCKIQEEVENLNPIEREKVIIDCLKKALQEIKGNYMLPFKFKCGDRNKTSHFIIFVTKDPLGYDIMKGIMADESTYKYQGVPTYEFNPYEDVLGNSFFPPTPLDELKQELLKVYSGRQLKVDDIYKSHNIGTPYIKKNYKVALLSLEVEEKIKADPDSRKRKKIKGELTMADSVLITFP